MSTHKIDIGLAFDGDADRVVAVDEHSAEVDGDFIMAICATHLNSLERLRNRSLVTTVMTNMGFDLAMEANGIHVVKTKVGDRYVLEEMLAKDIMIGGEQSGHIIFLEYASAGDGIITALQLLQVMRDTGKPLSELSKVMERLPQVLLNVSVQHAARLKGADRVWSAVDSVQKKLDGRGRILVRPSGTEPLVRVMVESDSHQEAQNIAEEIAGLIESELR